MQTGMLHWIRGGDVDMFEEGPRPVCFAQVYVDIPIRIRSVTCPWA